jgi:ATP-binding cassette subfamily B protein
VREGTIELRDVSFTYQDHAVLSDFTLTVAGGQMTAFVGESGGGKSTLLRLILYLLKPQCGRVLVDGQDLAEANLESYYQEVAYIPQEPPVFTAKLVEAIRLVKLDELVRKLPKGLDTLIGERGIKLSGGERQRLAFGRVLLQDPKIVILDEPTSALDSLTEHVITQNLMEVLRGKTVIVVAHRLQTVRGADRIIVLADGRVAQEGKFNELVTREGPFRALWEKQAAERADAKGEQTAFELAPV